MTVDPGLAPRETTPGGGMTALEIMADYERAVRERDKLIGREIILEDRVEMLERQLDDCASRLAGKTETLRTTRVHLNRMTRARDSWYEQAKNPSYDIAVLLNRISDLEHRLKNAQTNAGRWRTKARKPASEREAQLQTRLVQMSERNRKLHKRYTRRLAYWRQQANGKVEA